MPSTYAHARFGQQAAKSLPGPVRLTVQRFQRLYDVGCYGPDFFFYCLLPTKTMALGRRFHKKTGREFFETAARHLRENPSEGGQAYLYGVLCHYALDSVCHPLICPASAQGGPGHLELEAEFDRHLLTRDGKVPAHRQNLGRNLRLTWGECVTIAGFYPPATAYTVRQGFGVMSLACWALSMKNRGLLRAVLRLGGQQAPQLVMESDPNPRCAQFLGPLEQLYDQALERYPTLAAQLGELLADGTAPGPEFQASFG